MESAGKGQDDRIFLVREEFSKVVKSELEGHFIGTCSASTGQKDFVGGLRGDWHENVCHKFRNLFIWIVRSRPLGEVSLVFF
jgi:hypothetical protein